MTPPFSPRVVGGRPRSSRISGPTRLGLLLLVLGVSGCGRVGFGPVDRGARDAGASVDASALPDAFDAPSEDAARDAPPDSPMDALADAAPMDANAPDVVLPPFDGGECPVSSRTAWRAGEAFDVIVRITNSVTDPDRRWLVYLRTDADELRAENLLETSGPGTFELRMERVLSPTTNYRLWVVADGADAAFRCSLDDTMFEIPIPGPSGHSVFELPPTAAVPPSPACLSLPIVGDIDGNGCVDAGDYCVLNYQFDATGPNFAADLDGDGVVSIFDYDLLSIAFDTGCDS